MVNDVTNLASYVASMRAIAEQHGLIWDLPVQDNGRVPKSDRWSLNDMLKQPPPPASWVDNFSLHRPTLRQMKTLGSTSKSETLSSEWIELIKSAVVEAAFIKRTSPEHISNQIIVPLRAIATAVFGKAPSELTHEHIYEGLDTVLLVQKSGHLRQVCEAVITNIIDAHQISKHSPLQRSRRQIRSNRKLTPEIRKELSDRKRGHELPSEKAFWELTRIVFNEKPHSFYDCLRFEMVKLMIMLGLRGGEIASLPFDCLNYREYTDHKGIDAGKLGGVSKSLRLKHFAEKQRAKNSTGLLLFENSIDVPPRFEDAVRRSVERICLSPLKLGHY